MINRRTLLFIVVAIVVVVGAAIFVANQLPPTRPPQISAAVNSTTGSASPTTQPGQISPLAGVNGVQVLGIFTAPNQATLTFKGSGRITAINVQEGASVKKGDTLAVLDTTELQLSVQQAQAALAGAQARLDQTKSPSNSDLAAAQAAVDAAQANYDKLKAGANDTDLAAAQAAVNAAFANYAKVKAGPTANDLAPLEAQLQNAQAVLNQAQAVYDKIGGASNPYIGLTPQATALQTATNNYNAALAAYNNAKNHPTTAELDAALTQLQVAQAALARLTPDAAQLSAAASQLQQAQAALARLAPTNDSVAVAQAAVDQAQAALALAKQQLVNATLTAPFDGTVLAITPHVGESVSPASPILMLADLAHLQFQANVDQSLLEAIQTGESVTIVPDAFKDQPVSGKVVRVGLLATNVGGITSVVVTMDVNPNNVPLRPGLSGSAQIQTASQ